MRKRILSTLLLGLLMSGVQAQEVDVVQLRKAVEQDFSNKEAHLAYTKAANIESAAVKAQYDRWIKKNPKNVDLVFNYGQMLVNKQLPDARKYLLKVVALQPNHDSAYYYLWSDAARWGQEEKGAEFLAKASALKPENADYAFYLASGTKMYDKASYREKMLSIPARFPDTERGAQALYWLGHYTQDKNEKFKIYEQALRDFDPIRFSWSNSCVGSYVYLLSKSKPAQAKLFLTKLIARDTAEKRPDYKNQLVLVNAILDARSLQIDGDAAAALHLLDTLRLPRYGEMRQLVLEKRLQLMEDMGNFQKAYNVVLDQYVKEPSDALHALLVKFGSKIQKTEASIMAEVKQIRQEKGKPATVFNLYNYQTGKNLSLADLKGKVVLVTYWYPGCGPCRAEFPHFENVVRKFSKDQVAYVGINIYKEQEDYIPTFIKTTGYSFIPVRDDKEKRGNLVAIGAPTNYLIDKEGNIIFANFRTDADNEDSLERMIQELL